MNISIFGLGYVGCTIAVCLLEKGNKVVGVDVNEHKISLINQGKTPICEPGVEEIIGAMRHKKRLEATRDYKRAINNTEISIICVSTPANRDGVPNFNAFFNAVKQIGEGIKSKKSFHTVVIKSTVLPGTNRRVAKMIERVSNKKNNVHFCVISNPEFLRETKAIHDYYNAPFIVLGGENKEGINSVRKIYSNLGIPIEVVKPEVAEMLKYVNNLFHALKISFANEIGNICKKLDVDAFTVMDLFCRDKHLNISSLYLKPGFAYGGSCLSKDIAAMLYYAGKSDLQCPLLSSINESNENQKKRLVNLIFSLKKKKIGIIGLSFKQGTDDLRNSPMIEIIGKLLSEGFAVKAFDQHVVLDKLIGANKAYLEKKIHCFGKIISNTFDDLTRESEVLIINHCSKALIPKLLSLSLKKVIVDLRHVEELAGRKNYIGINW